MTDQDNVEYTTFDTALQRIDDYVTAMGLAAAAGDDVVNAVNVGHVIGDILAHLQTLARALMHIAETHDAVTIALVEGGIIPTPEGWGGTGGE
ncbi:hypothetical protein JCM18899A_32680 [Nocardioides sp. AN3]